MADEHAANLRQIADARVIEAFGHYQQRVANEAEHRRAVAAVEARLGEYRQQVRGLEQAKADQVLASQGQIARFNEAAHRLIGI